VQQDKDNGKQLHRTAKNGHHEIYERYYDYSIINMESSTTAPPMFAHECLID